MKLTGKTILVTGGAGFIGGHFVETASRDNKAIVYDNFTSSVLSEGDLSHLGTLGNLKVIKGDILDRKTLEKSMQGVDIVFHFAVACVRLSLSDERYVHDVNATGTLNTLLAAKKSGVKRFVYISSSEIYGTSQHGKMDEDHPKNPTTVYGMSKYMGELYTKHFNNHEGLQTIIIRPFNTYGPRSHFDGVYGEVIPRFTIRALNAKQPIIFGSGSQTRDFTYITDTVEGITRASELHSGSVINIARGQEVTISDIAKYICAETKLSYRPIMKPARPNDVARHYADITQAKKLLAFKPNIAIDKGLKTYITWVKQTYPDPEKLLINIPEINW